MRSQVRCFVVLAILALLLPSFASAASDSVRVTAQNATVRLKPDPHSIVIVKVGAGTVLDVIARQGNWFEVSLPLSENGLRRTGFISGTVVQLIQGPKAGSSGGVSASTEGDAVKKRIPGVEFIGKWNGYYRPDRFARFEATPSRQLVITRENGIFTIASRDLKNGGSAYSWHAVYVNDKLVCAGPDGKPEPPDPVTGLGPEVNRLPNGDLQLIQEGETRMRRVQ